MLIDFCFPVLYRLREAIVERRAAPNKFGVILGVIWEDGLWPTSIIA